MALTQFNLHYLFLRYNPSAHEPLMALSFTYRL